MSDPRRALTAWLPEQQETLPLPTQTLQSCSARVMGAPKT